MLKNFFSHNKNWLFLSLGSFFLCGLLLFTLQIFPLKTSAYLGTLYLILTLFPRNLASVLPKWKKNLMLLGRYRRDFGITSGIMFLVHGLGGWNIFGRFNWQFLLRREIIFGAIALLIFLALLVTSSRYFVRKLGPNWKKLHSLVWFSVPLALTHTVLASDKLARGVAWVPAIGFSLIIFFSLYLFFMQNNKQKLTLIGAAIALVLAVLGLFYVVAQQQNGENSSSNSLSNSKNSSLVANSTNTSSNLVANNANSTINSNGKIAPATGKTFPLSEVETHNSADSCWLIFEKKVYDMTSYLSQHAGGEKAILRQCGKEIDSLSGDHPGGNFDSSRIKELMQTYYLGELQE